MRSKAFVLAVGAFACGALLGALIEHKTEVIRYLRTVITQRHVSDANAPAGAGRSSGEVILTNGQVNGAGIQTRPAAFGPLSLELELPGEVSVNEDRMAQITAQTPGVVRDLRKGPGDMVAVGEVVAVIEGPKPITAAMDDPADEPPALYYDVVASCQGTVLARHVVVGEPVNRTPLLTVADLRTVWVVGSVLEKDVLQVGQGQAAVVEIEALPDTRLAGRVTWISNTLDETTRTLPLRVEVDNALCLLKPGLLARIFLTVDTKRDVFAVPREALRTYEDSPVVFIDCGRGRYQMRPVHVGLRSCGAVEILDGVREGEPVVTDGSSLLLAELEKGCIAGG